MTHGRPAAAASVATDEREAFLADVLEGLGRRPKTLPSKYFYDDRGAALFDAICELEEYYITRTELAIMREHVGEMARRLGPRCLLVEYGAGSGLKTGLLLDRLAEPSGYVPVDVSRAYLEQVAGSMARDRPHLPVHPVCADFTMPFDLPAVARDARPAAYFPGSTIGNLEANEAQALLQSMRRLVGVGGVALLGVDLRKPTAVLEAAYNDTRGVTAEFNRNLLVRINRELGADFDLDAFAHRAFYDPEAGRIEMHLDSLAAQSVEIGGRRFEFREGESIRTEYSHKYTLEGFASLADAAGFEVAKVWTDDRRLFSVQLLVGRD